MYTKHHTEGLILKSFDAGEADRGYHIFTRDLGLVYAKAQSVRELKSKLRFGLQELSQSTLSFIRAKDTWRITHAEAQTHFFQTLTLDKEKIAATKRFVRLLRRLLPPDEKNTELYQGTIRILSFLAHTKVSPEEVKNIEVLAVLRLLHQLGYLGEVPQFGYMLASPYINDMHIHEAGRIRRRAVSEINRALRTIDL